MADYVQNNRIKPVTYELKGFKEVSALLEDLPDQMQNTVLKEATKKVAKELLPSIRDAAPVHEGKQSKASARYGTLRQNLRVEFLRWTRNKNGIKGWRVVTGDAFWGNFLEFGTRFIPSSRSQTPWNGLGWFKKGVDENSERSISNLQIYLLDGIDKTCQKLMKKLKI